MAITDPLASVGDYHERYPSAAVVADPELAHVLLMVSDYLRLRCGREFTIDETATKRVFVVPRSSVRLAIDEFGDVLVGVKVDLDGDGSFADEVAVSGVERLADGVLQPPVGWPYNEIALLPAASPVSIFLRGQRVEVETRYGWPAVPEVLRSATIEIAAIWLLQSRRANVQSEELGRVIGISPMAKALVDQVVSVYRRAPRP